MLDAMNAIIQITTKLRKSVSCALTRTTTQCYIPKLYILKEDSEFVTPLISFLKKICLLSEAPTGIVL